MVKNKFLDKFNFFSSKRFERIKEKQIIKKLKKIKTEYTSLDKKFMSGTIAKNELDKYFELKKEMNEMAKKFTLKNGKLVLNKENNEEKMETKEQSNTEQKETSIKNVAPESNTPADVEQQINAQEQAEMQARQQAQVQAQMQAQMQAQAQQQAQMQAQEQQQAQMQAHAQAQQQEQERGQAMSQQKAEMLSQQEAINNQQNVNRPPVQPDDRCIVVVSVSDLPELTLSLKKEAIEVFIEKINGAMINLIPFRFGPFTINGAKILMYRFE